MVPTAPVQMAPIPAAPVQMEPVQMVPVPAAAPAQMQPVLTGQQPIQQTQPIQILQPAQIQKAAGQSVAQPEQAQPRDQPSQASSPQEKVQKFLSQQHSPGQVTTSDLEALGWLSLKSDAPHASQTHPAQTHPAQPAAGPNAEASKATLPANPAQSSPNTSQQDLKRAAAPGSYTRRAAANLINRLQQNPSRMGKLHPTLKDMVFNENKKSELISVLCDQSGSLEKVSAFFQAQEEKGNVKVNRRKAQRLTKKQMQDTYGPEAEKVMKQKEENGLVEEDENFAGGLVYLFMQKEDENESYSRSSFSPLSLAMCSETIQDQGLLACRLRLCRDAPKVLC